ncbi:MAG: hypothetical protein ACQETI_05135 [Halobacteriota archaeon]
MGVVLLALVVGLTRLENWQDYSPKLETETSMMASASKRRDEMALAAVLLTFAIVSGILLLASSSGDTGSLQLSVSMTMGLLFLPVIGFLVVGIYQMARGWGYHRAQAVALDAWIVGTLVVGAIAANLVLA